ncbi:LexA family protein [Sphingomonas sanxanigenens]|uniref:HTH cro/C1-type domain-containing protein n=1 Tax=Sphingomonas sanxanigenens DSM 19645 = NX02 TaxID=1123269 RepID=W0AEK9_9SPHN|nr:S24 family peptidase [Sphingomonas sanxanigenens]AHE55521.1 hypothetical protein NX02_19285 [Sphingomonas sanxanigenens DSM 19645 = NX02]
MPNRIREIRNAKGLTMRDLADKMGVHFTTLAKIERSERRLSLEWMERIASALEVTPTELIEAPVKPQLRMVPLIGSIPAGPLRLAVEDPMGMVPAVGGGPNAFALRVSGDSMDRVFGPGAIVLIDPDDIALFDGKIYAVRTGEGEATAKRFRNNPPRLEPDSANPDHKPMLLGAEPFQVVGRIFMFMNEV